MKTLYVENSSGTMVDYAAAVNLMDDDLREQLHAEGYDTEQEFFSAYEAAHEAKYGEPWIMSGPKPQY